LRLSRVSRMFLMHPRIVNSRWRRAFGKNRRCDTFPRMRGHCHLAGVVRLNRFSEVPGVAFSSADSARKPKSPRGSRVELPEESLRQLARSPRIVSKNERSLYSWGMFFVCAFLRFEIRTVSARGWESPEFAREHRGLGKNKAALVRVVETRLRRDRKSKMWDVIPC